MVSLTDDVGSRGVKRTLSRHRGNDANDPEQTSVSPRRRPMLEVGLAIHVVLNRAQPSVLAFGDCVIADRVLAFL